MDGVAFFDGEEPDEGLGDGFASLFAAVFDLVLELSAEGVVDVVRGGWVHLRGLFADVGEHAGQVDELPVVPPGPHGHGHDSAGAQDLGGAAEQSVHGVEQSGQADIGQVGRVFGVPVGAPFALRRRAPR